MILRCIPGKVRQCQKMVLRDVVMRLCQHLKGQGYHVYFDNFYTGVQLVKDLLAMKLLSCGTLQTCRKGGTSRVQEHKNVC